jgi:hypothetical protein
VRAQTVVDADNTGAGDVGFDSRPVHAGLVAAPGDVDVFSIDEGLEPGAGHAAPAGRFGDGDPFGLARSPGQLSWSSHSRASSASERGQNGRSRSARSGCLSRRHPPSRRSVKQVASPNPDGSDNELNSVTATSTTDAWAVGSQGFSALILHWNGAAWTQVASPPSFGLKAVTATSTTNAWAVGSYVSTTEGATSEVTLILHWNGVAWTQVASPPSFGLKAVTATSTTNAWAVGFTQDEIGDSLGFIEHWDG